MKICIGGKNNIAITVCKYLLETMDREDLLIIPTKNDTEINGSQKSFLLFAKQHNLKIVQLEEVYPIPDLVFLSLEFDRIIRPDKFVSDKLYNIHFSLLPQYKGMYPSVLPILFGDSFGGVTLHCMDNGIDTGDIIAQRKLRISKKETSKTLYAKYIKSGAELVIDYLNKIITGKISKKPQPVYHSSYYSTKTINYLNLEIELNASAWQIDSQIRAFIFRDYQMPKVHGFSIFYTELTHQRSIEKPGSIIENNVDYIQIATIDYDIKLFKDYFEEILQLCEKDNLEKLLDLKNINKYLSEQNKYGWTPLIVAAYNNSKRVFKYLLGLGANVNDQNFNGTTVMMYAKDAAIRFKDLELLDLILKNGGDVHLRDFYDKDVFYYVEKQSIEIYNILKKYD